MLRHSTERAGKKEKRAFLPFISGDKTQLSPCAYKRITLNNEYGGKVIGPYNLYLSSTVWMEAEEQ